MSRDELAVMDLRQEKVFDSEKHLDHRLKLKPSDTCDVIEETEK